MTTDRPTADGDTARLDAFRARIERLRSLPELGDADLGVLFEELDVASEELRVADDEVRAQRDELDRLLRSQHLDRWLHERLVAVLPVAVLVTDARGAILTANAAAAALLRMRIDRLLRKPVLAFIDTEARGDLRQRLARALAANGGFRAVCTLTPRGAEPETVEVAATVTGDPALGKAEVTWVLLGAPAESAAEGSTLARCLVELTRLPLDTDDREALLRQAADICERAFEFPVSVHITSELRPGQGSGPDGRPGSTEAGVRSAVTAPLRVGDSEVGTIDIHSDDPRLREPACTETVELLATAVAGLIHESNVRSELEELSGQLQEALDSRVVIEQAKGMIMVTRGCTPDEAFALLVRMSSRANLKLRDIAARMVEEAARGRR